MKKLTTEKTLNNYNSMKKNLISYAQCFATCVAFYFVSLLWSQNSFAKDSNTSKENLLQQYASELSQIENYLNNIQNLSAKFIQETSDGSLVQGKLFLSRPGKMRVEYDGSPKILVIVNGSVLAYQDVELDETSYLSTNTTPASFLTRSNISFSAKDVELTNVKKSNGQIKVSVMKKNRKEAGEFSVIFDSNPLQFVKMEVKDDLGQLTQVTLSDVNLSKAISSKMFVIKNNNLPQ